MRPVSAEYRISQEFGSGATQGIPPNPDPDSGWPYYVYLYGNYQPLGHAGLDIACPVGTPIYAPAGGTVIYAGWSEDLPGAGPIRKWLFYYNFGGILTLIQHDGWISAIAHQSNNDHVKVGQKVKEGQLIGLSGDTKTRTTKVAPHVHIEAIVDLSYRSTGGLIYGRTNPEPYFGGLAAMGETVTPQASEEDFLATLSTEEKDALFTAVNAINSRTANIEGVAAELPRKQYWDDLIHATARIDQKASAPDIAAQLNAAGIAEQVRDELVKLLSK